MNIYKISAKSQINGFKDAFEIFVLLISVFSFLLFVRSENLRFLENFFFIIFLILYIPTFILHLNYFYVNKNDTLICDSQNDVTIFRHGSFLMKFHLTEIAAVTYHKQINSSSALPWSYYYHVTIHLKSGKEIILTSLLLGKEMIPNLDPKIIKTRESFYRFIIGPSIKK